MFKFLTVITAFLITTNSFSQAANALEQPISFNFKNAKIETVLSEIETKSTVRFSYNPTIFNNFGNITYSANNQSLNQVLLDIFDTGIAFKTRGNYVILQKKKEEKKEFLVMGYISNETTNERIINASIFEASTLTSALSDSYGFYKIRLKTHLPNIDLKVQKREFISESVHVPFRKDGKINISLAPKNTPQSIKVTSLESIPIKPDSNKLSKLDSLAAIKPIEKEVLNAQNATSKTKPIENLLPVVKEKSEQFMDWLMSTTQKIHFNNISDSLSRPIQLSLLPFIGTNGRMSSAISNDISINIISGVSKSINKLEMGGFLNLVRENMTGVQMAGFGNIVGKHQVGLQMAGFANMNFGSTEGVLLSGATNLSFGKSNSVQIAGFNNLNFQESEGLQIAGVSNHNHKTFKGVQISGFINTTADTLVGSQIGLINIANQMKNGVQIGFLNLAKEVENVLPIGFFSYVKKGGYRRFELATNELGMAEVSFKTGVRAFYNIFSAQYNTKNNSMPQYSFGYGLGSGIKIGKRVILDMNLVYSQLATKDWNPDGWQNQMVNSNINIEWQLSKRIALFAGPSYSWYTTSDSDFDPKTLGVNTINTSQSTWFENQKLYSWLGFKGGIRLCNIK